MQVQQVKINVYLCFYRSGGGSSQSQSRQCLHDQIISREVSYCFVIFVANSTVSLIFERTLSFKVSQWRRCIVLRRSKEGIVERLLLLLIRRRLLFLLQQSSHFKRDSIRSLLTAAAAVLGRRTCDTLHYVRSCCALQ